MAVRITRDVGPASVAYSLESPDDTEFPGGETSGVHAPPHATAPLVFASGGNVGGLFLSRAMGSNDLDD